jgi:hypothetical protein
VYEADGIADAVDFKFTAAIRGSDASDVSNLHCPDENLGCPYTAWVICAIEGQAVKADVAQQVKFITCWDDSSLPLAKRAETCAQDAGLDFAAVSTCQSGSEVNSLLSAAATTFMAKWPQYSDLSGPYHVPHVLANGNDLDDPSYENIMQNLCSAGISAGACVTLV